MTHKLHDPSRPLGPDNPPKGYRTLKKGELIPRSFLYFGSECAWSDGAGADTGYREGDSFCPYPHAVLTDELPPPDSGARPAESPFIANDSPLAGQRLDLSDEKLASPLYQSILAQIDAHDSATRGERADRIYAEAMRMIGGDK